MRFGYSWDVSWELPKRTGAATELAHAVLAQVVVDKTPHQVIAILTGGGTSVKGAVRLPMTPLGAQLLESCQVIAILTRAPGVFRR